VTQNRKKAGKAVNVVSSGRISVRNALQYRFEAATAMILAGAIRQTLVNSLTLNALMMETVRQAKQVQGTTSDAEPDAGSMGSKVTEHSELRGCDICEGSCEGACTGCTDTCSGHCGDACAGGCASNCAHSCSYMCAATCEGGCKTTCDNTCIRGCSEVNN
jgi:hypothetical protein